MIDIDVDSISSRLFVRPRVQSQLTTVVYEHGGGRKRHQRPSSVKHPAAPIVAAAYEHCWGTACTHTDTHIYMVAAAAADASDMS